MLKKQFPAGRINLRKIVTNGDSSSLVRGLLLSIGEPAVIEDDEGRILTLYEGAENLLRYPVTAGGKTVGLVYGGPKISPVAELLSYLTTRELERRSLAGETLEGYRELSLFHDISERIPACTRPGDVLASTIKEIKRFFRPDNASVMVLNRETGKLEVLSAYGEMYEPKTIMGLGEGIAGAVFSSGRAEMVDDVASDLRYMKGANPAVSLLCAPLRTGEDIIGVINVSSSRPAAYTSADLKLLTGLASHSASYLENARLCEQLQETFYTTLRSLAEAIEKRDCFTGGHTRRVMGYSLAIGGVMGLQESDMERLETASMLHDIGNIGVRDSILLKPAPLDETEFEEMKMHTIYGEEILTPIGRLRGALPGVRGHHERYDGSGYPDGKREDEIDITARIIGVADSFDAMTSKRPYRLGLSMDHAFAELKRCSGEIYDPRVVDAFFEADVMEAFFTANARKKIIPDRP